MRERCAWLGPSGPSNTGGGSTPPLGPYIWKVGRVKGALQLPMNRYGYIRFAQVPERVSIRSFVVSVTANSKLNHLGAQGTFKV